MIIDERLEITIREAMLRLVRLARRAKYVCDPDEGGS
jgi:hypothetical protein